MRGLYINKDGKAVKKGAQAEEDSNPFGMKKEEKVEVVPSLYESQGAIRDQISTDADEQSKMMRDHALNSLKERRMRQK